MQGRLPDITVLGRDDDDSYGNFNVRLDQSGGDSGEKLFPMIGPPCRRSRRPRAGSGSTGAAFERQPREYSSLLPSIMGVCVRNADVWSMPAAA